VYKQNLFKHPN